MKYPNNIMKDRKNITDYKNRGLILEKLINDANNYYIENDIAYIYKKATPIGIIKSQGTKVAGYFKEASTLDYNGIYKGKYIEFDAKECQIKTSFPLSNIHKHQLTHIKNIINHGGIAFLIIWMNCNYYLLNGKNIIDFINNEKRKSIPFTYIEKKSYLLKYNYLKGIDYIEVIDKILEENNEKN